VSVTPNPTSLPSAGDAEIVARLTKQLDAAASQLQITEKQLQTTEKQLQTTEKQLQTTKNHLQWAELKIAALEARLQKARLAKYGPGSEQLSQEQLALLELEPGVSRQEVQSESQRPALPPAAQPRKPHPGRQSLPPDLPRVEKIVPCTPQQCVCPGCGEQRTVIGYEESEQLDVEPAKYFVRVSKREKRACPRCEEQGVAAAPLPQRIIDKGLASDAIIIDTVVNKYCDHLPLYRQSVILKRDAGVEISRATLDGWILQVGELLLPVVEGMGQELVRDSYIQADETPVAVQMQDGRGKNHQGYLWQYGRPGGNVVFDFRLSRGRDGPQQFLGPYNGILQTDGYTVYDQVGGPKMVHAGCWGHAERYFAEALELNPQDPFVPPILASIVALFAVDAEARRQGMTVEARHALRQEKSRPLLDKIQQQVQATLPHVLPASALAKACRYTLGLWDKLTRFLQYPILELSNNLAENSMRPVAVGRKNWIHIGSPQAGPKIAAILSVVESCRRLKVPVRDYLGAILPSLADRSIQSLAELTPAAWRKQRA
jgi:transposase